MPSEDRNSNQPGDQQVRAWSRLCDNWIDAHAERFAQLREWDVLDNDDDLAALWPDTALADVEDAQEFMGVLRRARNECLFVIAWRDLTGAADLQATLGALTDLAERSITAALAFARGEQEENDEDDGFAVIGMGKLGGRELNFSSDIDLVFCFADAEGDDEAEHARADRCKRLARRVTQLLSEQTADGFVFRVDTRLRPFGDSGPLAASLGAMESYYQTHGREWERYAWIKARVVAGDRDTGEALLKRLQPFVYRRYLDYGAFESIRDMKALIEKQVARRGTQDNIKLGRGGIREIEFIAQGFQLIRGGHEPALQDTRLLPVLRRLAELEHLPEHAATALEAAYVFLRRVENRLQMWDDRQTHALPDDDDQRAALAAAMDYAGYDAFAAALEEHRRTVDEHFQQVFAAPQIDSDTGENEQALLAAWDEGEANARAEQALAAYDLADASAACKRLLELRHGMMYRGLGDRGRRRIRELLPLLLQVIAQQDTPDAVLARVLGVLEQIIGRSAYVALLVENPAALSRLVALCAASPWITRQIEAQPILLDTLLDARALYRPPGRAALQQELNAVLADWPETDLEQRMDTLRRFQQQAMLRIAAADVSQSMPLMVVSDRLTELAEVVLTAAVEMAWVQMSQRYGKPVIAAGERDGEVGRFAVIGYGKLGGLELGYGSDLDLVFVFDSPEGQSTDGKRGLSHEAFFLRLAQRLIHVLSTQTGAGRAYEVDMRLRPSGQAGLLVTHIDAFAAYQHDKAWTWEHQALVRARPVAGDAELGERFRGVREAELARGRDHEQLRNQVREMRDKMRANLDQGGNGQLDLKQMPGGLIDIEFLAQYAALRYGPDCTELLIFTDTIRILETLESAQLLDYATTRALTDAYRAYRARVHAAALQHERPMIDAQAFAGEREAVRGLWQRWLEAGDG